MRIALVNPVARKTEGYHTIGTKIPQLGLQVLARLVSPTHEVDIIDEMFGTAGTEDLLGRGGYDLVGVTGYTSGATRAYEIAAYCRGHGIPCIMGGPHAWAVPDEPAEHFDSVAVGECDEIWPQIVADAEAGKLQKRYDGSMPDLEQGGFGAAAQGLHPVNGNYDVACLQTSRGCPVGCDYCSVTRFNGSKIRRRPIGEIVAEWNTTDKRFIFVVDDNFFGVGPQHAEWAKELLRAIIKHGKKRRWFSQTSLNMGQDVEAMKLAYKAGCRSMLVGIESFNPENLKAWHKGLNLKLLGNYKELVDGFHRGGVSVFGGFVIGSDTDDEDTAVDTLVKAVALGVDIIQITNLTPLPGTKFYERLKAEGKLIATDYPADWERYTFIETVHTPAKMSAHTLDGSLFEIRRSAAEHPWAFKRALRTLWRTKSLETAVFVLGMNRAWVALAKDFVERNAKLYPELPARTERTKRIEKCHHLWFRR